MKPHVRKSYVREYKNLLHGMISKEIFEQDYQKLHLLVNNFPKAKQFVEKLYDWKKKVAFYYVKEYFTAGCKSSQRVKSIYSLLKKHHGTKVRKNHLIMLTDPGLVHGLFEMIIEHEYCEDMHYLEVCASKGSIYSKFVQDHLDGERAELYQYKAQYTEDGYVVGRIGLDDSPTHNVILQSPPKCSCAEFTKMNLPCRHIAVALYHAAIASPSDSDCRHRHFLDIENVPLRWRLTKHPLFGDGAISKHIGSKRPADHKQELSKRLKMDLSSLGASLSLKDNPVLLERPSALGGGFTMPKWGGVKKSKPKAPHLPNPSPKIGSFPMPSVKG